MLLDLDSVLPLFPLDSSKHTLLVTFLLRRGFGLEVFQMLSEFCNTLLELLALLLVPFYILEFGFFGCDECLFQLDFLRKRAGLKSCQNILLLFEFSRDLFSIESLAVVLHFDQQLPFVNRSTLAYKNLLENAGRRS